MNFYPTIQLIAKHYSFLIGIAFCGVGVFLFYNLILSSKFIFIVTGIIFSALGINSFQTFTINKWEQIIIHPSSFHLISRFSKKHIRKIHEKGISRIRIHYSIQSSSKNPKNAHYLKLELILKNEKKIQINDIFVTDNETYFKNEFYVLYHYLKANFAIPIEKIRHTNIYPANLTL